LVDRLTFLSSHFAIEVVTFAVMGNHVHLLLRTRPDLARQWQDEEVARRYAMLLPRRRSARSSDTAGDPLGGATEDHAHGILSERGRVAALRRMLSDLGFFHRLLKEPCARMWNREDAVTGHFWEGRYKSIRVLDDQSLLRVATYVDLNEVRAQVSASLVSSMWSGARRHWASLRDALRDQLLRHGCREQPVARAACSVPWRGPLAARASGNAEAAVCDRTSPHSPMLEMPLARYLRLIDLDGRRRHPDKRGFIAPDTPSAIEEAIRAALRQYDRLCAAGLRLTRRAAAQFVRRLSDSIERQIHAQGFEEGEHTPDYEVPRARGSCYGSPLALAVEAQRRGVSRVIAAQAHAIS
jgi:REP element-mobilizing transposase RayT